MECSDDQVLVYRQEEEEEEEAGLRSVLSGEVEQPLAQQGVVLFQVLDQVGLLLHNLLQTGALSVTQITTHEPFSQSVNTAGFICLCLSLTNQQLTDINY